MKDLNKNLSKADEKKLAICRERVFDACVRLSEVADILEKRGWQQAPVIRESTHVVNQILKRLQGIEEMNFKSKQQ